MWFKLLAGSIVELKSELSRAAVTLQEANPLESPSRDGRVITPSWRSPLTTGYGAIWCRAALPPFTAANDKRRSRVAS